MATEQTQKVMTVTPKAAEKIKEFMKEEADKPEYLRVYVQHGAGRIGARANLLIEIEGLAPQGLERHRIDGPNGNRRHDDRERNQEGNAHPHRAILSASIDGGKVADSAAFGILD